MSIFVTSDTHFCHSRSFLYGPRGFESVNEMNEAIVDNWNRVVKPGDTVYHLGDVMLNDDYKGHDLLGALNGKIYLILGNHDTDNRIKGPAFDTQNIAGIGFAKRLVFDKYHFFLTHYPTMTANFDYNTSLKQMTINLCGHTHTKDRFHDWNQNPIYHCELDAHDCTPVSIEEIIEDIKEKWKTKS